MQRGKGLFLTGLKKHLGFGLESRGVAECCPSPPRVRKFFHHAQKSVLMKVEVVKLFVNFHCIFKIDEYIMISLQNVLPSMVFSCCG